MTRTLWKHMSYTNKIKHVKRLQPTWHVQYIQRTAHSANYSLAGDITNAIDSIVKHSAPGCLWCFWLDWLFQSPPYFTSLKASIICFRCVASSFISFSWKSLDLGFFRLWRWTRAPLEPDCPYCATADKNTSASPRESPYHNWPMTFFTLVQGFNKRLLNGFCFCVVWHQGWLKKN